MTSIVDPQFPATLRRLRRERDLSLRKLSSQVYYGKTLLHDLEQGTRQPTVKVAAVLDAALNAGGKLAAMVLPATRNGTAENDVVAAPGLGAELSHTRVGMRRRVGEGTPAMLLERTARLRRLDDHLGGADTYHMYRAELDATTMLLRDASYTEATGRALMAVLAEQAQLAGWAAFDAGRHGEAETLYRLSLSAATEGEDQALAGNAWIFIAYQNLQIGKPGVDEAAVATESAGGAVTPTVRALLHSRRAWVHAVAGQASATERELALAHTCMTAPDDRTEPDWVYWVDHLEMEIMTGRCWSVLHRPVRAISVLEQALKRFDDTRARDKALYLSWLADAYLDANEVEQACATASRTMGLSTGVGSIRPLRRLESFLQRLNGHAPLPCVVELKSAAIEWISQGRRLTSAATQSTPQNQRPKG